MAEVGPSRVRIRRVRRRTSRRVARTPGRSRELGSIDRAAFDAAGLRDMRIGDTSMDIRRDRAQGGRPSANHDFSKPMRGWSGRGKASAISKTAFSACVLPAQTRSRQRAGSAANRFRGRSGPQEISGNLDAGRGEVEETVRSRGKAPSGVFVGWLLAFLRRQPSYPCPGAAVAWKSSSVMAASTGEVWHPSDPGRDPFAVEPRRSKCPAPGNAPALNNR